jgi:signal transduction histidine kinase
MQWKRVPAKWLWAAGFSCAVLALIPWIWHYLHRADSVVPSHSYQFQAGRMDEWRAVGGNWQVADGILYNKSYERGSKLLTGSSAWGNYQVSVDVRYEGDNADMGVIIRTNHEKKEGSDTYNGYYIGLRTLDEGFVIGRSSFGWSEARPVSMPGGFRPSVWYRLHVVAYGCNIAASAQNLATLQTAWIAFEEPSCLATGHIGLRSLNAGGMWRNVNVSSAGLNDYMALRQHAASVERPEVLPGPPWWTPWRVGMIFTATLTLALLTQLAIFRMQRWKAYTIMQERERLANQIHDTMAQSFAGVGYQIQGIRRSVLRGDHLDQEQIADQLSNAYQLVRSCHNEASRTVSLLAGSSPRAQLNLLAALTETANKIAGDQIGVVTHSFGTLMPLNLRLADALLRIGQEAIANAVAHSDPTKLTISLIYEEDSVELVVEDNGCGFEPTPKNAGFGILGMQNRAREVAGTLRILSSPGHGTTVRIKTSLQQEQRFKRLFSLFKEEVLSTPPDFRG